MVFPGYSDEIISPIVILDAIEMMYYIALRYEFAMSLFPD